MVRVELSTCRVEIKKIEIVKDDRSILNIKKDMYGVLKSRVLLKQQCGNARHNVRW
jgi:hypothetical protein